LDELDTTVRETTSKLEQETGLRISLTGQVEQLSEEGAAVKQVLATTTLKYQQASATAMVRRHGRWRHLAPLRRVPAGGAAWRMCG
jgi:hypothetical protein